VGAGVAAGLAAMLWPAIPTRANAVSYVTGTSDAPGAPPSEKAWLPAVRLRAGMEPALPDCNRV
jgi:hypothetical protein